MITIKHEASILEAVKAMSELEFSSFISECAEHIRKNKWEHIIDECFEIETFEDEVNGLKEEIDGLSDERSELERRLERAIDQLDEMDDSDENIKLMKILAS